MKHMECVRPKPKMPNRRRLPEHHRPPPAANSSQKPFHTSIIKKAAAARTRTCMSLVHSVRLSRRSCMMRVESCKSRKGGR